MLNSLDLVCPELPDKISEMHNFDLESPEDDVLAFYAVQSAAVVSQLNLPIPLMVKEIPTGRNRFRECI